MRGLTSVDELPPVACGGKHLPVSGRLATSRLQIGLPNRPLTWLFARGAEVTLRRTATFRLGAKPTPSVVTDCAIMISDSHLGCLEASPPHTYAIWN
jgi:hypothetical protein